MAKKRRAKAKQPAVTAAEALDPEGLVAWACGHRGGAGDELFRADAVDAPELFANLQRWCADRNITRPTE